MSYIDKNQKCLGFNKNCEVTGCKTKVQFLICVNPKCWKYCILHAIENDR